MIVIHIQAKIKAEQRDEFFQQIRKDVEVSRGFAGCLCMDWLEDVCQQNTFTLYEEWESQEAFDAFKKSEHFKHNGNILFPMMAEKPQSAYYTASILSSG